MPDAELSAGLQEASTRAMFFAFISKGGDGKLIVSKFKISPQRIAEAKKATGGGIAVTGQCLGSLSNMVFQVDNGAPAALALALKQAVMRDTGLFIVLRVQSAADGSSWQAARQKAINGLKALAAKAAAGKDPNAAAALREINGVIVKLPANPALDEIDQLEDFIRDDDTIAAADESLRDFHDQRIREPLLKALKSLKP